jgi:hypothetical protein
MTKTHYDVEDIPSADADTQLALYEQACDVVEIGDGQRLFQALEATLREIFVEAENVGNGYLMNKINEAWEDVQRMAAIMGQQGAVLTGANNALGALKTQRDAILEELNGIIFALQEVDSDHPRLVEYTDMIRELEMDFYAESSHQIVLDDVAASISDHLMTILPADYSRKPYMVASDMLALLQGEKHLNDEQRALLIQLCRSLEGVA